MPTNTSRLGLPNPIGADTPAQIRLGVTTGNGILDNAAIYQEGTLVSRAPAGATNHGYVYRTTDAGSESLTWSNGTVWMPLGLIPQSTSLSRTAASGQALFTSGSSAVTVTLPTNTAGALVSIKNGSTGGTTVSGTNIQGLGLSSASSFPLGAVGASAILLGDGTNWQIIAGQQDTGEVALALQSGFTTVAGYDVPSVRVIGDRGYLSGALQNITGAPLNAGQTAATIPAIARPVKNKIFSLPADVFATGGFTAGASAPALWIPSGGSLTLWSGTNFANNTFVDMDWNYRIT